AAATLIFGVVVEVWEVDRRADLLRREAEYHGRMRQEMEEKAAYWEALANDPSKEDDLPLALYKAGLWPLEQALEIELEPMRSPSRPRWRELASGAKGLALRQMQEYRKEAGYYDRQKWRYDRAALFPWLPVSPETSGPD